MKKSVYFLLPTLFAVSCSQNDPLLDEQDFINPDISSLDSQFRTEDEVIFLAQSLVSNGSNLSRSETKQVDKSKIICISSHNSRATDEPLMYAVNFTDEQGYALISANRDVTPVLGIVDSGSFNEEDLDDCEAYQLIKRGAEQIAMAGPNPDIPKPTPIDPPGPEPLIMAWKEDTIKSFHCNPPLVEVQWGQQWPENICTSNLRAGCVPVAALQAMSYLELPEYVKFTFWGEQNYQRIDWTDLKKHKKSPRVDKMEGMAINFHWVECESAPGTHTFLGRFARELGYRFGSHYYQIGDVIYFQENGQWYENILERPTTGTPYDTFKSALKNILFNVSMTYHGSINSVYSALNNENNKSVAIVLASDNNYTEKNNLDRHAFVIDATAHIYYEVTIKYNYNPATGAYEYMETPNYIFKEYVHCNWGEGGQFDGYFLTGLLDMKTGLETVTEPEYSKSRSDDKPVNYIKNVEAIILTKN